MTSHPRKRKHYPTEDVDAGVRKKLETWPVAPAPEASSSAQKRKPTSPGDKGGKSRALDHSSEFRIVTASLTLSIPPVFASDLRAGVEEMLDSMVMRYIPSLQGVLLAHSSIQFLSQTARIHGDCPFAVCNVGFDATVWGPRVSMKLVGRINLCSPDHISLLVHRTFNVSIPRHHIPQDQWLFEYGPAENDPEFGEGRDRDGQLESTGTADKEKGAEVDDSAGPKGSEEAQEIESSGRWVHHLTGSELGDPDGYVEFTVIGLTVANEMLSLQGSIQPDPFSPEHIAHPDKEDASHAFPEDETSEDGAHGEDDVGEDEEESDGDGFKHLAKLTDEAKATQRVERAREEAERVEKNKKQKQQESGDVASGGRQHDKGAKKKRKKDSGV